MSGTAMFLLTAAQVSCDATVGSADGVRRGLHTCTQEALMKESLLPVRASQILQLMFASRLCLHLFYFGSDFLCLPLPVLVCVPTFVMCCPALIVHLRLWFFC